MPISSFILRKSLTEGGSALRRTYVTQDSSNSGSGDAVYDSGLRADGYFVTPAVAYAESVFEANVYDRNKVVLNWRLSELLIDTPTTVDFDPVEMVIRGSGSGEPITPEDGFFVLSQTANNYVETINDISSNANPYIVPGKWCYYSLFIKYANNQGDSYYEKMTDLSVQIPYDFNSTDNLWKRIPTYYRELDEQYKINTANYEKPDGPLYRLVELFGWELDKIRTTIYETMRVNDPEVIHSSAINALGYQVGLPISKDYLGTSKLRALLNNAGNLQRNKGTQKSVEAYISSLTGCGVSTNYSSGLTTFSVHPMRVNLFSDPFFKNSLDTTNYYGSGYTTYTHLDEGGRQYGWGVGAQGTGISTTPPVVTNDTHGTISITLPAKNGTVDVYIYSRSVFNYNNDLIYYASADSSHEFTPRFAPLSSFESGYNYAMFDSWNNDTLIEDWPHFNGVRPTVGSVPFSEPTSSTVVPVFHFSVTTTTAHTTTITFSNPLFEYKNQSGDFFTGSNTNGGFVPTPGGASNEGKYDYHWGTYAEGSSPHTNFSYYTLDGYRSQKVTENIIANNVMPVTMVNEVDYDIIWDVLE